MLHIPTTDLLRLKASDEFSDLTIKCGTRVFDVHKSIVCPRSEHFNKASRSGHPKVQRSQILRLVTDELTASRKAKRLSSS